MASEARFHCTPRIPLTESSTRRDSPKKKDRVSELMVERKSSHTPPTSPTLERKATPLADTIQTVQSNTPTISRLWRSSSNPDLPVNSLGRVSSLMSTEMESRMFREHLRDIGIQPYDVTSRLPSGNVSPVPVRYDTPDSPDSI